MAAEQPGVHLAWRGLTYDVAVGKDAPGAGLNGAPAGHKRILHGLTGEAVPGSVLAVMGPSGSGKSTLIAALGGRLAGSVGGEVILNGVRSANAVPPELVHLVGYVAQEDYLFGVLTVRETLNFSLMLRMSHLTTKERDEVVGRAIREFDLEECADTVIGKPLQPGGVSGGERRRVSIAAEVQHDPSLVLLDEPTSGLDAATALVVVQLLRERANRSDRPAAVVLSIHQPRATIPPLLDNVLLLAAGRDMYFGPTWTLDASGAPSQVRHAVTPLESTYFRCLGSLAHISGVLSRTSCGVDSPELNMHPLHCHLRNTDTLRVKHRYHAIRAIRNA